MKLTDFSAAMAMYADADQRATGNLIEMLTAAVIVKLAPPTGEAVASVSISPQDISDMLQEYRYEARYDDAGEMTLFITSIVPS